MTAQTQHCLLRGTQYTLTANEMIYCQHIAHRRVQENQAKGTTIMTYSNKSDYQCHLQGVLGELIISRLLEKCLGLSFASLSSSLDDTHCRNVTNDTLDVILPNGVKLDVKATEATEQIVVGRWKKNPFIGAMTNVYYVLVTLKDVYWNEQAQYAHYYPKFTTGVFQGAILVSEYWRTCQPWHSKQISSSSTAATTSHRPIVDTSSANTFVPKSELKDLPL